MTTRLEKALNLRRNEFALASLLFLFFFLAIGCFIMGESVGDAIFLSAFPGYLPHVIIATTLVVGVLTSVYVRLSHYMRMDRLMSYSLLFFGIAFVLLWWMAQAQGKWVYPLLYVWVYTTGAMAPTMGWTLANCLLTTREAKRVFGFIGGGATLGAPCAGFLTADILHHGHARPETLILAMALAMALCALLAELLFRQSTDRLAALSFIPADGLVPKNLDQVWAHIRGSRYLLLITALIAIGCITTTIISYQFRLVAYESYGANRVALATFFGRFNGYFGLGSFLLQMFLTSRLLRSFGVRITLLVLPVVFFAGSFALLLAPVLLTACVLKGSHNLLRFSLDKSSTELLYLPVAPTKVKNQVKSFIDGFVWRTADGVAGIVLFVFATHLHLSPGRISLVGLPFILSWIVIAHAVRREYLKVLRQAVERRTLEPEGRAVDVLDSTTTVVLAQALERGSEQQVLYGLSLFEMGREPAWHPALCQLLRNPSPTVRQRALQLLSYVGTRQIIPQVEKMLEDDSLEVRAEALHYLASHCGWDPLILQGGALDAPPHCLQSAVVVHLARRGDQDCLAAAELILQAMLASTAPEAALSRREAARALGMIPSPCEMHSELGALLKDQNREVVEQAILSAGRIHGHDLLPSVIDKLGEPRLLAPTRDALVEYGPLALSLLSDRLNNDATPGPIRRQIPGVLARIGTREAAQILSGSLIQSDPGLRYEIVKALNKLRAQDPALVPVQLLVADLLDSELVGYCRSFQIAAALGARKRIGPSGQTHEPLLTRALLERMEQELERIFRLLALLYSPRDIRNAYVGIISPRREVQANALELLEHLLPQALYRRFNLVIDSESSVEEKLAFAERICRTRVTSKDEALRILLFSMDSWLCACALHAVGEARLAHMCATVQQVPHERDPLLDETWKWACSRLKVTQLV